MSDFDPIGIGVDPNEGEARAAAQRIATIITDTLNKGMQKAAREMSSTISRELNKIARSPGTRQVAEGFDQLGDRAAASRRVLENFNEDLELLQRRSVAVKRTLADVGADESLALGIDIQLRRALAAAQDFEKNFERLADDPDALNAYRRRFANIEELLSREVALAKRELKSLADLQRQQSQETLDEQRRASRERIAQVGLERSRLVGEFQQETTLRNAEIRTQGQLAVAAEQRTARRRIEIMKFAFRQIQTFERAIGAAFKASAAVVAGAFARVENVVFRIAGVFRRSNADLTDGLEPSLRRRERLLRGSLDRQERAVRSSMRQQSALLDRFDAQASTGVFGALSGRSRLGALFGGGLALGGGFAAFQGLRRGFDVGGDFVQGLAVLQAQLELTDQQMEKVREQSIELGNDITLPGVSALDAAQAISLLSKQFAALGDQALPNAQRAAKGVLQLSRATASSAEDAAQIVGASINVFGIEAAKATQVADQITTALSKAAGVGFNEFSQAFRQAAAVFAQFQEPALGAEGALTELNTAIAVLAKGGLVGSDAGTSLKQLFLQANREVPEVTKRLNEVVERAGEVGSVFFDEAGNARALSEALDILRRGLAGLTDQQRTATLQKIFGSDATRAAAILVGESAESYDALAAAINREGAAADIAAAQNTGLRGALDALSSVLETRAIKTYERYQEVAGRVVLRIAELIDAFFEGDGAAKVFRSAITGLVVALGGLLAAKAAAEAIQFLGIALRFALTPVGFLVTAVGVLGAAIGGLRAASENFRFITDGIRILASEALGRGVSLLSDALGQLADFLADTVLPAIGRLAQQALPVLLEAVRIVAAVFTAVLIPAARAGFGFLVDAAEALVPILRTYLIPAVVALGGAWVALNAPIAVTIGAFAALGAALYILRQQSETVRNFTDNLADTFVDLGQRLAGFGRTVGSAVASAFSALAAAVGELFSRIDFRALGLRVLGFVNTLGRLLGQAITSRLTVRAVVAIGVAAAALAGAFLAGFVEGVVKGLPGAIDEIVDLIRLGLEEIGAPGIISGLFSNAFTGIAAVVGAALLTSAVLGAFRNAGTRAAGAFSAGFIPGVRRTGGNLVGTINGLFGGRGGINDAITRSARLSAERYQTEFSRTFRNFQRLGVTPQTAVPTEINKRALKDLQKEWRNLEKAVGPAQVAAALYAARTREALAGVRTGVREVGNAFRGIDGSLTRARASFSTAFAAIRENIAASGGWRAVGQRAGVALVSAFGAVLAGQQGGTAGLVGVVGATLGALAVGGPIAAGITAIAGGATLLWQELRKGDEWANRLKETTELMVELFKDLSGDELVGALADRLDSALRDALNATGTAGPLAILPSGFFRRTAEDIEAGNFELERSFADVLRNINVSSEDINRAFAQFEEDPERFRRFLESPERIFSLVDGFGSRSEEDAQRIRLAFQSISSALDEADVDPTDFVTFLRTLESETASFVAQQEINAERARLAAQELVSGFTEDRIPVALLGGDLRPVQQSEWERILNIEAVDSAFNLVTGTLDRLGIVGVDVFEAVREELEKSGTEITDNMLVYLDRLIEKFRAAGVASAALSGFSENRIGLARFDGIGGLRTGGIDAQPPVDPDDLEQAFDGTRILQAALDQLNNTRTDRVRGQIEALQDQLTIAEEQATRAREALLDFLTGGYGDSAQQQLDQLIGRIGGIGSQIEEGQLLGGIRGDAQVRSAIGDFGSGLAQVINAAIEEGITGQNELRAFLAPLFGVFGEEASDGISRIISTVGFDEGITGAAAAKLQGELNRVLGGTDLEAKVQSVFAADREVERIQDALDSYEAELNINAQFSQEQISQALLAAGIDQSLLVALDIEGFLAGQSLTELQRLIAEGQAALPAEEVPKGTTTPAPVFEGPISVTVVSPQPTTSGSSVVSGLTAAGAGVALPPGVYTAPSRYVPGVLPGRNFG